VRGSARDLTEEKITENVREFILTIQLIPSIINNNNDNNNNRNSRISIIMVTL
jgi:hypothetical protein